MRQSKLLLQLPGRIYLLIAVIIFAAANSVTRKLTELGASYLVDGSNPISFCNVLFVGNLWALLVLLAIYGRRENASALSRLSFIDWLSLLAVAILAGALAPALTFFALDITNVNNVVLISRIEPPLALALSVFLLKARVNSWVVVGAVVSFIGVALTIVLQPPGNNSINMGGGLTIGQGELMAAAAAVAAAAANIISKVKLKQISLGVFSIFRTAVGTVVFFTIVVKLFGIGHFQGVLAPLVWQWMLLYSVVIVVGGQLAWFQGLKTTTASDVSLVSAINPIVGIIAAYLILQEIPTRAQYVGGSIIILGIIINLIGVSLEQSEPPSKPLALEMDKYVGFKGI